MHTHTLYVMTYACFVSVDDPYDYQGRSYLHIPQDLDVNLRSEDPPLKCFIPKKCIHTWYVRCMHMYSRVVTYMHANINMYMYVHTYACTLKHTPISLTHTHICLHKHTCTQTHPHTSTQTHTHHTYRMQDMESLRVINS